MFTAVVKQRIKIAPARVERVRLKLSDAFTASDRRVDPLGDRYIQTVSLIVPGIWAPYIVLAAPLSKNLVEPGLLVVAYLVAPSIEIQRIALPIIK
jgi:hypothetical protein